MLPPPDSAHFRGRPGSGTKTGRVWDIADELSRKLGRRATHLEVRKKYVDEEGGEATTCTTTYYNWKSSFDVHAAAATSGAGLAEDAAAFEQPADVAEEYVPLTVASDGRLLIPLKLREAMLIDEDGRVTARLVDGELRLVSPRAAIRRAQRLAQKYKKPGESVVDQFLAERRAMWGEE